jgi:hypothetical protein
MVALSLQPHRKKSGRLREYRSAALDALRRGLGHTFGGGKML